MIRCPRKTNPSLTWVIWVFSIFNISFRRSSRKAPHGINRARTPTFNPSPSRSSIDLPCSRGRGVREVHVMALFELCRRPPAVVAAPAAHTTDRGR
jgi:hypothetical protein